MWRVGSRAAPEQLDGGGCCTSGAGWHDFRVTHGEPAVRIRYAEPSDAEEVTLFLVRNRTYFQPSEPTRGDEYFTVAEQRRRLERAAREREAGRSAMFLIDFDGDLVGRMNLGGIVRGAFQSAGVRYAVDRRYAGRGIATAGLRELVRHAFDELDLHRVQGETQTTNLASQRVLARCGFKHYGRAPEYAKIDGSWQTIEFYQLINRRHGSAR